jgi:iron complex transport system permease protein
VSRSEVVAEGRGDRPVPTSLCGETGVPGRPRHRLTALVAGTAVLLIVALLAMAWGSFSIPPEDIAVVLWRKIVGAAGTGAYPASWDTVILEIRLPRVILAALVGAALAPAGAVYQGLFRNPLADPYLIGVSSGAGLGATIAIVFGVQFRWEGMGAVSLFAFGGALAATVLVYALSRMGGRVSVATLLLAGVALGAFLTSFTTFLMFQAPDAFRAVHVVGWLMGSFALASWPRVYLLTPFVVVGGLLLWSYAHRLNVLQLDEDQARQLGIPLSRTRLALIVLVSLVMAAAVSVSGVIGFVGLIVPHAIRLVWGPDHRFLLPMSAVGGALFMILSDGLARTLLSPAELPVGVVTAFCGAPFFLYLLRKRRHLAYY